MKLFEYHQLLRVHFHCRRLRFRFVTSQFKKLGSYFFSLKPATSLSTGMMYVVYDKLPLDISWYLYCIELRHRVKRSVYRTINFAIQMIPRCVRYTCLEIQENDSLSHFSGRLHSKNNRTGFMIYFAFSRSRGRARAGLPR